MEFLISLIYNGDPLYTAGQLLGLLITVFSVFIYYAKRRNRILLTKLITDVLNVVQQALIGAYTGSLLNGIAVFREIVFYNRTRKKWASHIFWLFFFIFLMGLSPLLTWNGFISLLPAVGSVIAVVGFYMQNPTHTRILGIFSMAFWLAYSFITVNVGAVIQNVIMILSAIAGLIRDFAEIKKREKQNI